MTSFEIHKHFKRGETIFHEGEQGDCAYIIESGQVNLTLSLDGNPEVLGELREGALFGEMAVIDNQLRTANAIAVSDCKLLVIPGQYIDKKIENSDKFVSLLLNVILQRHREMRNRLVGILSNTGVERTLMVADHISPECRPDIISTAHQLLAENNLHHALKHGELELFFQPILDLSNSRVVGCESLIRWNHPENGLVLPMDFIGLAEETGLIVPMGLWIIEDAIRASLRFHELSNDYSFISINLSARQFAPIGLIENIKAIFDRYQVNPGRIKFEITESVLLANPLATASSLHDLKSLGADIAIDDFGTGYSSFSYLHQFPIDALKIDKSFVSKILYDTKSREIIKSICNLAKEIGLSTVAEGVETIEEHQILLNMGVNFGQGYLYAKPMPEAEFCQYLSRTSALPFN